MRIRSLLLSASALALLATPAYADPISIGSAVFAALVIGDAGVTVATIVGIAAVVGTAVAESALLQYLASAIQGKPSQNPQIDGIRGTPATGGIVPRSILVGYTATAGSIPYAGSWGTDGDTPNAFLTYVVALSDLPIASLTEIWENATVGEYDTSQTPVTQGYPIVAFRKDGKDNLWVKFHDGTQTAADTFLTSTFGSDPDYPYGTDRIGKGVAYAVLTARLNPQVFNGMPQYRLVGTGAKLYDPRLDGSEDGTGSHRFNDQTTWEVTLNPMVINYNILRGVSYNSQPLYGLDDLPPLRLPTASWFAAMNECDASVDDMNGSSEAQYRCGTEIQVNVAPADAINALLTSCNGRIAEIGGIYKVLVGASGSSVLSFTDDEIIITQPQSEDPFPTIDSAINGLTATYLEPTAAWEAKDLPLIQNDDAVDEDGENFTSVSYATVFDPGQGQRLQQSALNEAQNHRKHSHTLPPMALVLEPLDVVSWSSDRNGYSSKGFLTSAVTIAPNLDIPISISETDPADYDFDTSTDYVAITVPVLSPPGLPDAPSAPTGFDASQQAWTVTFVWDLMVAYGYTGYDLVQCALHAAIGTGTYIVQDTRGNSLARSDIPAGNYTFYLVGRDALDVPGEAARGTPVSLDFTVSTYDSSDDFDYTALPGFMVAAGLTVPQVVASRAAFVGTPSEGNLLFLTANDSPFFKDELLRYTGSAWTNAVPAVAVTGTLTDSQLADIAAAKITGQITTTQITNNAITTGKLASGSVTTNEIAANTITAADIAAGTITATEIASNAITAAKINAGAVTAGKIDTNAITAGTIAAGAINVGTIIVDDIIVTGHLVANAVTTGLDLTGAGPDTLDTAGTVLTLLSGTFTASGNKCLVSVDGAVTGGGGDFAVFELYISGSLVRSWAVRSDTIAHGGTDFSGNPIPALWWQSVSAGSHSWALKAYNNDGNFNITSSAYILKVTDWQR